MGARPGLITARGPGAPDGSRQRADLGQQAGLAVPIHFRFFDGGGRGARAQARGAPPGPRAEVGVKQLGRQLSQSCGSVSAAFGYLAWSSRARRPHTRTAAPCVAAEVDLQGAPGKQRAWHNKTHSACTLTPIAAQEQQAKGASS